MLASLVGCSIRTVHRAVAHGHLPVAQQLPGPNGANLWARDLLATRDPFIETQRGMVARTPRETAALREVAAKLRKALAH